MPILSVSKNKDNPFSLLKKTPIIKVYTDKQIRKKDTKDNTSVCDAFNIDEEISESS